MFETSLSWLFILGSIGIGIYACITISKIRSLIEKQSKDLNERHSAWQILWAREYSNLENKVEDIQRTGDDTE
jgi:hypothetical protein